MKILWVGTAALIGLGVVGAVLNHETAIETSVDSSDEIVTIEGQKFKKTKDGRYNVNGTPTLFIDNSRVHTKYLSFNEEEQPADDPSRDTASPSEEKDLGANADELARQINKKGGLAPYDPQTAAQFAKTLKQTREQAKERKSTLDELSK